ncbi:hypothetical protein QYE76_054857 [Lolium multiflorum]|uniref:Uncharacterized protein n=1 Tax=Lolium multiflorum TaxID=4521 RepID=A0AAD8WND6_LOLMU|nr:hypothetical protein QYE76_054857 [Lolium multiflorum]
MLIAGVPPDLYLVGKQDISSIIDADMKQLTGPTPPAVEKLNLVENRLDEQVPDTLCNLANLRRTSLGKYLTSMPGCTVTCALG